MTEFEMLRKCLDLIRDEGLKLAPDDRPNFITCLFVASARVLQAGTNDEFLWECFEKILERESSSKPQSTGIFIQ